MEMATVHDNDGKEAPYKSGTGLSIFFKIGHLIVDGRIILKWFLRKQVWRVWIGFIWLRTGTGGGLL
jgi:hypothetical protein